MWMLRLLLSMGAAGLLSGCMESSKPLAQNEYSYLRPYIKQGIQWSDNEFNEFISNLNDIHLCQLALEWHAIPESLPGISVSDNSGQKRTYIIDEKLAIEGAGGRQDVIDDMKKKLLSRSYFIGRFHKKIEWHEIVAWTARKAKVDESELRNSSYDVERTLLSKSFADSWDKLDSDQRNSVIQNSELNKISDQDKAAIVAATGAGALITLNATVAMSGFAFYTTMSSAIAASANVIGVTLPFAVYSGASTTVSALSGPVGWSIAALSSAGIALYALTPDEKEVSRMVVALHLLKSQALEVGRDS